MRHRLKQLLIACAGGVLFLPAVSAPFVADAYLIFYHIQREGIWGIALTPGTQFLHPLTSAMYFLEHRVWGLAPLPSHLLSILAHALCVLLVGVLAKQLAIGTCCSKNQWSFCPC